MNSTNVSTNATVNDADEVQVPSVHAFESTSHESEDNDEHCEVSEDHDVNSADNDDAIEPDRDDAEEFLNNRAIDNVALYENNANTADNNNRSFISTLITWIFFFIVARLLLSLAGYGRKNRWHHAGVFVLLEASDISRFISRRSLYRTFDRLFYAIVFYFKAAISYVRTTPNAIEATIEDGNRFGFQIDNHGNSDYEVVTDDNIFEFIDEKTTVYHDESGSSITLHYEGSELVSVTHDEVTYTSFETVPSNVADMLVAAQSAVDRMNSSS